ncbi:MAG: glycosyltransferase family 4 protein [Chloroflexi bacterium]|nr:glycosyltransferase family 4 protein [Chloroflexota bacterium]
MRILIFSNTYKPTVSGVVTSIALFRQGLVKAGHNVHIIAPEYEDYQDKEPYVFRFAALDLPERVDLSVSLSFKTTILPTVRGVKPALIHSQHPFGMGRLATAFARDLNLPLVFTLHSHYAAYIQQYVPIAPKLAGVLAEEVIKRYLEKCAHVVAPTAKIRDFILHEYEADVPVTVVPTPVDLSMYHDLEPQRIRAELGLKNAELLVYVGRLAEEKSLDFLLRAFARIVIRRPQARLLLVGKGMHERSLRRLARKLGLEKRIIFSGPVPHDEIPHYVAAADLFVFASLVETQGLVLIEAMAAGTPVVAVEAPGSADALSEGGGILISAQEETFADAVQMLLADHPRRRAMGEQAERAVQRYTIPSTTARMVNAYEEAIDAGPRPVKKMLERLWEPREPGHTAEAWREVGHQIRSLGESLSTIVSTAWEGGEDARQHLHDMRFGLEAMIRKIDQEMEIKSSDR